MTQPQPLQSESAKPRIAVRAIVTFILLAGMLAVLLYEFRPSLFPHWGPFDPLADYNDDPLWEAVDADLLREALWGAFAGTLLALVYVGTIGWNHFGGIRAALLGICLVGGEWYVAVKMAGEALNDYYSQSVAFWDRIVPLLKSTQWDQLANMLWSSPPFILGGIAGALVLTLGVGIFRTASRPPAWAEVRS